MARSDTLYQCVPVCPRCGEDVSDDPPGDFPTEGDHETECGHCGAVVVVTVEAHVTYSVREKAS